MPECQNHLWKPELGRCALVDGEAGVEQASNRPLGSTNVWLSYRLFG
jgi:hypothetical protein